MRWASGKLSRDNYVCDRMREGEGERESVCERKRESACVRVFAFVCERKRETMCVGECEREKERDNVCG